MSTRADLLESNLTPLKEWMILGDVRAYRHCAEMIAREQWRLFFETGRFNKQHDIDKVTFVTIVGNAARVQMCRYQVVGMLKSWIGNRENDFREVVNGSDLPNDIRHMLHTVNVKQAWFLRQPIEYGPKKDRKVIPDDVRRLARSIMRGVMRPHRRPAFGHISMLLDARAVSLELPQKATQKGRVARWVRLSLYRATPGNTRTQIDVPLLVTPHHARRQGELNLSVTVVQDRGTGRLRFALSTDQSAIFEVSRAAYQPQCERLPLDFGLTTMFATGDGELVGRSWLAALKVYDRRITNIAKGRQRRGGKPRDSRRYRATVTALRGWIKSEVNRVLNRLIALKKPAELVLEKLDFRNPELSARLNRIVQNCGRAVIRAKLADLADRFGIENTEINPAYTSQTCSRPGCGYVDRRNRNGSRFRCLWCGYKMHADVNGARNVGKSRAFSASEALPVSRAAVLAGLVRRFGGWDRKRPSGEHGDAEDPRLSNRHFTGQPAKRRKHGRGSKFGVHALAPACG